MAIPDSRHCRPTSTLVAASVAELQFFGRMPELLHAQRTPITMELDIDLDVYMRIIGLLMALFAVIGAIIVSVTVRDHNRKRDEESKDAPPPQHWDGNNPESFGHR
jgi:hypothetical protein